MCVYENTLRGGSANVKMERHLMDLFEWGNAAPLAEERLTSSSAGIYSRALVSPERRPPGSWQLSAITLLGDLYVTLAAGHKRGWEGLSSPPSTPPLPPPPHLYLQAPAPPSSTISAS